MWMISSIKGSTCRKEVYDKVQRVYYDKIGSFRAMLKSVWIILAITAYFSYEIWQLDVKTKVP